MTTRSQAAASPVEVGVSGRTLRMSPMTDVMIGEMDNWYRAQAIRAARASLSIDATEEERQETMDRVFRLAPTLTWLSKQAQKSLQTIDGLAQVMWLGLRPNHPELEIAEIREMLTDPQAAEAMLDAFVLVNPNDDGPAAVKKNTEAERTERENRKREKRKRKAAKRQRLRNTPKFTGS